MPLVLAGIDEAGYGPLLGPLCVGMAALRIDPWRPGDPAPDLWALLDGCICRKPSDKRRRIAIEDSKKLKLPNDSRTRHPLTHLERGVHAFLRCLGRRPETDLRLIESLGAALEPLPWYGGPPLPAPASADLAAMDIAGNVLAAGLAPVGVSVLDLSCAVIGESAFNRAVRTHHTKAAATAIGLAAHLRAAWEQWGPEGASDGTGLRIVCDRQGGRTDYAETLAELVPGASVRVREHTDQRSRYDLSAPGRAMTVIFQTEAETAFLPVALASMAAKLARETLMARFNRHWCARLPELKPTAGYTEDARRWLRDAAAGGVITAKDREAMIRIA